MISAPTGESQKGTGRIIAMVVSGPIPGRTPMAGPITQPKKQSATVCQVSAMPNPMTILERMSGMSEGRWPERNGNFQAKNENAGISDNQDKAQQQQWNNLRPSLGKRRHQNHDGQREDNSKRTQKQRKCKAGKRNEGERPPPHAIRSLRRLHDRHRRKRKAKHNQKAAHEPREITRAHCLGGSGLEIPTEPQSGKTEGHIQNAGKKILAGEAAFHPALLCHTFVQTAAGWPNRLALPFPVDKARTRSPAAAGDRLRPRGKPFCPLYDFMRNAVSG